jgi:hypothetical protein
MKKCYYCKKNLGFDCFGKNASKPDGLASECRKCKSEQDKKYREKNKKNIKNKSHNYYLKNKDYIYKKTLNYQKNNPDKVKKYSAVSRTKIKTDTFSYYSNGNIKCKNCSCKDLDILTIDHINGKGSSHRIEIFGDKKTGGCRFYFWLKRNNFPNGYQVLCFNCQFRKRFIEMQPDNTSHLQKVRAKYVRNIKIECLNNYGGIRCNCGESDIEVLTLDHVNDDGAIHRKTTGKRGFNFYMMLRKNKFPNNPPLQVMCLNCQFKKRCNKNG